MSADNALLHSLRAEQLKALARIVGELQPADAEAVRRFAVLSGQFYDTRNLSDKSLEQIDVLCSKYFDKVK